jgi:hypothetical protein
LSHFSFLSYGITDSQWPDPWAGVTECCSLLARHREITGGGEASIERDRSGGSQFRIVEPQCRAALQIRCHLAHRRWSKIGLHMTQDFAIWALNRTLRGIFATARKGGSG